MAGGRRSAARVDVAELCADAFDLLLQLSKFAECVLGRFQMEKLRMEFVPAKAFVTEFSHEHADHVDVVFFGWRVAFYQSARG